MATIPLPPDFSEFLKLMSDHDVRYLLVGGYAVGYHGYVRATADLDIWAECNRPNAKRIVKVLREFGFDADLLKPELFVKPEQVIRMGVPPIRIEILTSISGVNPYFSPRNFLLSKAKGKWSRRRTYGTLSRRLSLQRS